MKKLYIQPSTIIFNVEMGNICVGSENLPIGNGSLKGDEEGFERAAGKSRYSDWSDFEGR